MNVVGLDTIVNIFLHYIDGNHVEDVGPFGSYVHAGSSWAV